MRIDRSVDPGWGIAVVRVAMGFILVLAGAQKWMGGIGGFSGFVGQIGAPGAEVLGPIIAAGEVLGGLLILLGLKTRYVALWFMAEFIVTTFVIKLPKQGFDAGRVDLMILAASIMLVLAGAGKLALDEYLAERGSTVAPVRRQTAAAR